MKVLPTLKVTAIVSLAWIISACGTQADTNATQAYLPEVSVAQVVNERITEWDTFTGRLEAPETVHLRPRVSGYIDQVMFQEGAVVNAGDVLFKIDDRSFVSDVKRIEAALISAQAQLELAESEHDRAVNLIAKNAISAELLDTRAAQLKAAEANVAEISASLELAELQLSFTNVEAPISGRVSRALVTKGNFVNAGQSELTSLVSMDTVHAYFDADEQTYLHYAKLAKEGNRLSSRDHQNIVLMGLATDSDYPHQGYIDFVDNSINPSSGTIRGRAVFDNTEGTFIPGLFSRIRLVGSASYDGILIDDKAVGTDLNNQFVLVINEDNTVEYRAVELGEKLNGLRIIKSGLAGDDKIVVNGLQRVRPGATVNPIEVDMASSETIAVLKQMQLSIDESNNRTQTATADSAQTEFVGG
ncbi:MAG: efflux RND transporter periplasmic adaptor subunit [Pseudomonadota bacterium]